MSDEEERPKKSGRRIPFRSWLAVPDAPYTLGGEELGQIDRHVLAVYAKRWRDGADVVRIGVGSIVAATGYSERSVTASRGLLVRLGALKPVSPGGRYRGDCASFEVCVEALGMGASGAPIEGTKGRTPRTHPKRVRVQGMGARKGARKTPSLERENLAMGEGAASTWDVQPWEGTTGPDSCAPADDHDDAAAWPEVGT